MTSLKLVNGKNPRQIALRVLQARAEGEFTETLHLEGLDSHAAQLDQNVAEAWAPFAQWASDWLRVDRISSEDDIQRAYLELLDGKVDPSAGTIVDL